jgi:hypothetical protein
MECQSILIASTIGYRGLRRDLLGSQAHPHTVSPPDSIELPDLSACVGTQGDYWLAGFIQGDNLFKTPIHTTLACEAKGVCTPQRLARRC